MAIYIVNRQHTKPRDEEHAGLCWVQEKVEGDLNDAKLAALNMIYADETEIRQRYFITGLVMLSEMPENNFVSWTHPSGIRYSIGTGV